MTDSENARQDAASDGMVGFWRRYDDMEARLARPVSERMLALLGVSSGMSVLDVASGRGEPALLAAQRVGPQGQVLAVDVVDGLLKIAQERADREQLKNLEFLVADAETLSLGERRFDAATVRWGLMYMRSPERALASIHRALKPGGRLAVASWAEPGRVPFASLPREVLARHRDVPPLPGDESPGVFRHADRARFEATLVNAGFSVENTEELEVPVVESRDARDIVAWVRGMGGFFERLIGELAPERQRAWEEELAVELERHHRRNGRVSLGGVTRITVARAESLPTR